MYIPEVGQQKVFQEVFRMLAPGGRFLVRDVNIQIRPDPSEGMAMFPFRFHLPGGQIVTTAYGVHWPPQNHDLEYYQRLARSTGFIVVTQSNSKQSFTLNWKNPEQPPDIQALRRRNRENRDTQFSTQRFFLPQ